MPYTLQQVEEKLKLAFERAKEQITNNKSYGKDKLGTDIGHEQALAIAEKAPVVVDASHVQKDHLIQRGRFRYHWEKIDPGDVFYKARVWRLHVPDRHEYSIFLLRARLYQVLRGIPHKRRHKTAKKQWVKRANIKKSLRVTEEALEWAGIMLQQKDYYRDLPNAQGIINSPWTGTIEQAIEPPPPNGGRFVHKGNIIFVIRVWTKPSVSELHNIVSKVGGTVEKVDVKVGELVNQGQQLIQLENPFEYTGI